MTTPVPGPPASVLSAILREDPDHPYDGTNPHSRRMAWFAATNPPNLPSLMTDGVFMPDFGLLDANVTTTGYLSTQGLPGATAASRYVGATASGAPTSGTFLAGDWVLDQTGKLWICTAAGSPGTWAWASAGLAISGTPTLGQVPMATSSSAAKWATHPVDWVNVVSEYGADPSGVGDSTTAFQNAITASPAGTIYVPVGTYLISSPLTGMHTNFRMTGQIGAKLHTTASGLFNFGTSGIAAIEIDHLTLDVTGGDVFTGTHMNQSHFHDLTIFQRSAGYSIWNCPNVGLFIEDTWERIVYTVYGATRTVPAWSFVCSAANDLFNENVFEEIVANNNDADATQCQFWVQCDNASGTFQNNTFRNITFENPLGGCISILSGTQTTLENCRIWDLSTAASASMFVFATDATSTVGPRGIHIVDCGRSLGNINGSGVSDIQLDSTCADAVIDSYRVFNATAHIDLGNSPGALIVGGATTDIITNTSNGYTQMTRTGSGYTLINSPGLRITSMGVGTDPVSGRALALSQSTAGQIMSITRGNASDGTVILQINAPDSSGSVIGSSVSGDSAARWVVNPQGKTQWGPGNAGVDTNLYRSAAGTLKTDTALVVGTSVTAALGVLSTGSSTGTILSVTNTTGSPSSPNVQFFGLLGGDSVLGLGVTGDTVSRLAADTNGKLLWGAGGSSAGDVNFYRSASGLLKTDQSLQVGSDLSSLTRALGNRQAVTHGLIAWNYDFVGAVNGSQPVSGRVYVTGMQVSRSATCSNLFWIVQQAAGTATTSQNWVGLYNSSGTLLQSTGVDSSITSGGLKTTAITPQAVTPGLYWVGWVFNYTGANLQLGRGSGLFSAASLNLGLTTSTAAWASAGTGTTLASITPASNSLEAIPYWAGIG